MQKESRLLSFSSLTQQQHQDQHQSTYGKNKKTKRVSPQASRSECVPGGPPSRWARTCRRGWSLWRAQSQRWRSAASQTLSRTGTRDWWCPRMQEKTTVTLTSRLMRMERFVIDLFATLTIVCHSNGPCQSRSLCSRVCLQQMLRLIFNLSNVRCPNLIMHMFRFWSLS